MIVEAVQVGRHSFVGFEERKIAQRYTSGCLLCLELVTVSCMWLANLRFRQVLNAHQPPAYVA